MAILYNYLAFTSVLHNVSKSASVPVIVMSWFFAQGIKTSKSGTTIPTTKDCIKKGEMISEI